MIRSRRGPSFGVIAAGLAIALTGCSGDGGADPCAGVTCSGHGDCMDVDGQAACRCREGFHAEGYDCKNNTPCYKVTCSGHGTCIEDGAAPTCQCDQSYYPDGLTCIEATSPCDGVDCGEHGRCVDDGEEAECLCDDGWLPEGLTCVEDPCEGVDCGEHGWCEDDFGSPVCRCHPGYYPEGLTCVEALYPCDGVDCCGHGECVEDGGVPTCQCEAGYHDEGLSCVLDRPDPWPPAIDSLYQEGVGCILPACSPCNNPGFIPTGKWQRTLITMSSNCSATIQMGDPRASEGNVEVEDPAPIDTWRGNCDHSDAGEVTGAIFDGIVASCDSNVQTMDIVSFETSLITFSGDTGTGTARIYLTEVPAIIGGDCVFEMDVVYER